MENKEPAEEQLHLSWQYPKGLIGLSFANMLLRILTIGIYHFWAKTEVRKRIWSAIRINGEPLTYTGRGLELFLGFLIVFFLFFLPIFLIVLGLGVALGVENPAFNLIITLFYIAVPYLIGIAIYRAQRYRLARTRWRGIRGSLEGSPHAYAWTYFWTLLLIPFTLGWIIPWRTTKLQSIVTNNTKFGDRPLLFDAQSGALYGPFTLLWFGTIAIYSAALVFLTTWFADAGLDLPEGVPYMPQPADFAAVFGALIVASLLYALFSSWYQARTINHFANCTHFENATFSGNTTALGLIWLSFSNFTILLAGALLFVVIVIAIVLVMPLQFIDLNNLSLPDGQAVQQLIGASVPLILIFGFGLFMPIVQTRSVGYVVRNMQIAGTAPVAKIVQSSGTNLKYGEGLAEAFDVDAF